MGKELKVSIVSPPVAISPEKKKKCQSYLGPGQYVVGKRRRGSAPSLHTETALVGVKSFCYTSSSFLSFFSLGLGTNKHKQGLL